MRIVLITDHVFPSVHLEKQVLDLPLNGRQATDLIQLTGAAIPAGVNGTAGFPGGQKDLEDSPQAALLPLARWSTRQSDPRIAGPRGLTRMEKVQWQPAERTRTLPRRLSCPNG